MCESDGRPLVPVGAALAANHSGLKALLQSQARKPGLVPGFFCDGILDCPW